MSTGAWSHINAMQALQALSLIPFINVLGWSEAETEALLVEVRKDLRNRSIHAYWPL